MPNILSFLCNADLSIPTKSAVFEMFPLNFLSWVVKYSFSKFSLASFNGIDEDFSALKLSFWDVFKDSLIIFEILSSESGDKIAILSIKFLNSLTLPGHS